MTTATHQLTLKEAVRYTLDACNSTKINVISMRERDSQIREFLMLSGIAFDSLLCMATAANVADFI